MKRLSGVESLSPKTDLASRLLRLSDLFRVSIREVWRKRRRYMGVVMAIALGTAGFITIVTMGRDLKMNFNNDLDLLGGATIINAYFEPKNMERQEWFREPAMKALAQMPGVRDVTRVAFKAQAITTFQDKLFGFNLLAVEANYWQILSYSASAGRLFDEADVREANRVCVLGTDLARQIFGGGPQAVGQSINIDNNLYKVVGVLGGVRAAEKSMFCFVPISTGLSRVMNITQPYSAYVRCNTWDDVKPVADQIVNVVGSTQTTRGLQVAAAWEALKQVQRVFWWVTLFIYFSIGATMVLGGFGIWNIMMAAVTSRTREIGLKKAMGAEDNDILLQFLMESLSVTFGASLLGVLLGRVGIEYMSRLLGSSPPEGMFVICLLTGLAFAAVLGIGAGLTPSIRASRMQVVEAMRYE